MGSLLDEFVPVEHDLHTRRIGIAVALCAGELPDSALYR